MPLAMTNFHPSGLWAALFFIMIILMGLSSMLVMVEVIITAIMDEKVAFRNSRVLVLLAVCCVMYIVSLPLTTQVSVKTLYERSTVVYIVDIYGIISDSS